MAWNSDPTVRDLGKYANKHNFKQAIELLEEAKLGAEAIRNADKVYTVDAEKYNKALALLKLCETCGGSGEIEDTPHSVNAGMSIKKECPQCNRPDFMKQIRKASDCQSQEPAKKHNENCPARYDNFREAGIQCTCKSADKPVSEFVEGIRFELVYREIAKVNNLFDKAVHEACDRLEAETQRVEAAEASVKSKQAIYDAYKAIAENKVIEMADKLKEQGKESKRRWIALNMAIGYIGENDSSAIAMQREIEQVLKE